jgi:hypothetical protein
MSEETILNHIIRKLDELDRKMTELDDKVDGIEDAITAQTQGGRY